MKQVRQIVWALAFSANDLVWPAGYLTKTITCCRSFIYTQTARLTIINIANEFGSKVLTNAIVSKYLFSLSRSSVNYSSW